MEKKKSKEDLQFEKEMAIINKGDRIPYTKEEIKELDDMSKSGNPLPDEKVCFNCKNLAWSVGIGLGIRCHIRKGFKIPSINSYTCDEFQYEILPEKKRE
jgi:hypothetical protein